MNYEGLNKEEVLETVLVVNNNNNINVVSNSDSDSSEEDVENNEDFFDKGINDQVIISPQITVNAKVIHAMKNLQALYNEDANKIIKETTQDKAIKNLNYLINLAMVTSDTMLALEEPTTFADAWNHPNANSHAKWQEAISKEFTDMNKQQL